MGTEEEQGAKSTLPLKLFLLGFLLMFAGVIVLLVASWLRDDASVSGGLILIIGFIPIVVGFGPDAFSAILIGAILTIIAFTVFLWMRKQIREG